MKRTRCLLLPVLLSLAWTVAALADERPDSPQDLAWLQKIVGEAAAAYEGGDEIYLVEVADGRTQRLGAGVAPEFSPDSSKLAWIRGDAAVGRMRRGDDTVHTIIEAVEPEGGVHWISNDEVVVRLKAGGWRRVALDGRSRPVPELDAMGFVGRETDVKLGDDGVWTYVAGTRWATSDGARGHIPGNCSSSLSPDGRSVGGLQADHLEYRFIPTRPGGAEGSVRWIYAIPQPHKGFDNHRFSSNDPRFILAEDEKHNQAVVLMIGTDYTTRIGERPRRQSELYGDFTVGDGRGDAWPLATLAGAEGAQAAAQPAADHPPADPVVVRATLRDRAPLPRAENYPDALVVYIYEVRRIRSGELPGEQRQIAVVHHAIRGGTVAEQIRDREPGSRHTLRLRPFSGEAELAALQIAFPDDEMILDAQLWFSVDGD